MSDVKIRSIKVLDWPGKSPDHNPIEKFWHIMGAKIAEKNPSTKLIRISTMNVARILSTFDIMCAGSL